MKRKVLIILVLINILIMFFCTNIYAKNEVNYIESKQSVYQIESTNSSEEPLISRTRFNTILITGGVLAIIVVVILAINSNNNKNISI